MEPMRVYVDTSVIGGCFDAEFAAESRALMQMARDGRVVLIVSDVLEAELRSAPQPIRDFYAALPPEALERFSVNSEADRLHQAYLAAGIVSPKWADDAQHVANATVAGADVIVSWNFKHIVHLEKIKGYNAVNRRYGYQDIEIRSPREVV
jgi:predicted nucleic acid-binding protein